MSENYSRWYDKDPVLSMSMRTLSTSSDAVQIAVALNLIKVIIEHNIREHEYENIEDIVKAVEDGLIQQGNCRWYDLDSTVRTAIQMLEKCSLETKQKVAVDMAKFVVERIVKDDDAQEDEEEYENSTVANE
ncbi:hypothetical protein tpqmel_0150 [Candidatus Gastranaerophilus sp. (ex Termes propinquus)]|nr:hypothetical protein tpqmel_0150 [Candidatus Gastranaerophilus sp. (ex Termes propinquus)]